VTALGIVKPWRNWHWAAAVGQVGLRILSSASSQANCHYVRALAHTKLEY